MNEEKLEKEAEEHCNEVLCSVCEKVTCTKEMRCREWRDMSYYSLLRIKCDEDKCIRCRKCLKTCPMDVEVNNNSRSRKNATECILCQQCTKVCPTKALKC